MKVRGGLNCQADTFLSDPAAALLAALLAVRMVNCPAAE
jgi:hypothetical protein